LGCGGGTDAQYAAGLGYWHGAASDQHLCEVQAPAGAPTLVGVRAKLSRPMAKATNAIRWGTAENAGNTLVSANGVTTNDIILDAGGQLFTPKVYMRFYEQLDGQPMANMYLESITLYGTGTDPYSTGEKLF